MLSYLRSGIRALALTTILATTTFAAKPLLPDAVQVSNYVMSAPDSKRVCPIGKLHGSIFRKTGELVEYNKAITQGGLVYKVRFIDKTPAGKIGPEDRLELVVAQKERDDSFFTFYDYGLNGLDRYTSNPVTDSSKLMSLKTDPLGSNRYYLKNLSRLTDLIKK